MSAASAELGPDVQAVLEALDALYNKPDNEAKQGANRWLQGFQKTPEAWQTANTLLLSQTLPVEPRLFAAQTFRIKATFDLDQIPRETLVSLRTTLLTALQAYKQGPRVIQTQICVTLASLALQLRNGEDPEWGDNVVGWMIDRFGKDPSEVKTLLSFLTVLPEEATTNQRIPISNTHYNERTTVLLARPAPEVIRILTLYSQAQGITPEIQDAILTCLAAWLRAGELSVEDLISTPLFALAFESLADEQLFDIAVDVLCDIIHETQEVEDNQEAIQSIVPQLAPLRPALKQAIVDGDDDKVRGLCRVFVQAGETYHQLVLRHKETFLPIVEAIFECVQYSDLEIVQITFRFWYFMSRDVRNQRHNAETAPFLQLYQQLLEAVVRHLRFPDEMDNWNGQERDDFKSFRHYMGDTLKDCCQVLGSQTCLARSLGMIQDVIGKAQEGAASVQWQDVEAPLFSMRAMGAEADTRDDEVLPQIMNIIPTLPSHPRLTYAALLVISRYTEWIRYHPDRIPTVLSYISAGFAAGDADVAAAAAQAFHYLGRDCSVELHPFLPQLHDFYQTVTGQLDPEDVMSVSEAIAYVIASLPQQEGVEPLVRFTQPLLADLASIGASETAATDKLQLRRAADRMEQIERFVHITSNTMTEDTLPASCSKTCEEAYGVVDTIIAKYGSTYFVSERACALIRRAMVLFGDLALPVLPHLVVRLVATFERTGFPAYIWIVGKCIDRYGGTKTEASTGADAALSDAFARITQQVVRMLQATSPADIPDVMDDYLHTCSAMAARLPQPLFLSPVFPQTLQIAVSALEQMYQAEIVAEALNFARTVVGHDALGGAAPQQQQPEVAQAIRVAVQERGGPLCAALLHGMVSTFDPDTMADVAIVVRMLLVHMDAASVQVWLGAAIEALDVSLVPLAEKHKAMAALQAALAAGKLDEVRPALQVLYGASRKSRERDRLDRQSSLLDQ